MIIIGEFIYEFLENFIGMRFPGIPGEWSIEYIIRCESTHFLFSAFAGLLAFLLTWTIFFSKSSEYTDRYIYRIGLSLAVFVGVTLHIIIDAFTSLA